MTGNALCKMCGAPILVAMTVSGRTIQLNRAPTALGSFALDANGMASLALVLSDAGHPRYRSHFVTCPQKRSTS